MVVVCGVGGIGRGQGDSVFQAVHPWGTILASQCLVWQGRPGLGAVQATAAGGMGNSPR